MKQIPPPVTFLRTYDSPSAEQLALESEESFCTSTGSLQDLDTNPLYEDDFDGEN